MAKRKGFKGNRRVIGSVLKSDAIGRALDAIAEPAAEKAGGHVDSFVTDRQVRSVVVGAEDQAIDGAATKAVNEVLGFASRAEWRHAFASGESDASERAHATDSGYAALPERAGRR